MGDLYKAPIKIITSRAEKRFKCKTCKEPLIWLLRKEVVETRQCPFCGTFYKMKFEFGEFKFL